MVTYAHEGLLTTHDHPTTPMQLALRVQRPEEPARLLSLSRSTPTLIGRGSISDIMLPDSELAPVHSVLAPNSDGTSYTLTDAWSELGTLVGGRAIPRTILKRGDAFTIGEWTITLEDGDGPLERPSTIAPPQSIPYRLVFADNDASAWPISTTSTTTLGRNPFNDIPVTDGYASEYHALLTLDSTTPDQLPLLIDLHSSNGTYVNGRPIHRTHVAPGDVIAIGRFEMELRELEVTAPQKLKRRPHVRRFTPADEALIMPRSILPTLADLLTRKRAAVLQALRTQRAATSAILQRNLRHILANTDLEPFAAEPNPDFFYASRRHVEALNALIAWIQSSRAVAGIDGPPGSGKSLLLACLARHLKYRRPAPVVVQPVGGELRLDALIEATLARAAQVHHGLSVAGRTPLVRWHAAIAELRRRSVLVVFLLDDVPPAPNGILNELVELLDSRAALAATRILVAGPPALRGVIADTALAMHLGLWCHIRGFPPADVPAYLSHCIQVATGLRAHVFTRHAIKEIAEKTRRLPGAINSLAGDALALAADHSLPQVSHDSVSTILDLDGSETHIVPAGNEFA